MAEGTVDAPITFRSELDPDDANYGNGRGLWGGLIINGYAPISNTGGVSNVEGLTSVQYGGTNPDDNSGVLRYVRVWNGGSSIAPDNEINGITLAGVGRGTVVEYCEVALNLDDGFEMFGGTVDLNIVLLFAVGDDALIQTMDTRVVVSSYSWYEQMIVTRHTRWITQRMETWTVSHVLIHTLQMLL